MSAPRPSKYRNRPTVRHGIRYASAAEARRADELAMMQATGIVRAINRQPRWTLGVPENVYVADFLVVYMDGRVEVEDVKGALTRKFARDLKLWRAYGQLPLRVLQLKRDKWSVETVHGGLDAKAPGASGPCVTGYAARVDAERGALVGACPTKDLTPLSDDITHEEQR